MDPQLGRHAQERLSALSTAALHCAHQLTERYFCLTSFVTFVYFFFDSILELTYSGNTQAKTPELQEPDASFHNRAGRGEITEDEIRLEKNIDILDENGLTGLHWAASYGQVAATTNLLRFIHFLLFFVCWKIRRSFGRVSTLRCGASVNCVGLEGETALLLAAAGGHHDVLRILLKEGADVNHQDNVWF